MLVFSVHLIIYILKRHAVFVFISDEAEVYVHRRVGVLRLFIKQKPVSSPSPCGVCLCVCFFVWLSL